ncbi:flagella assembly protein FlgT middle domain-containing protein [Chitinibacter sp. GC72]|uniref:flagella assembly protein FlgT middle domain-containing protein n=1 Tax=Chitinibacter sp. GC72 TaxID=1526917 RepID=UPI0012FBFF2A|nr:flagella assembly protein FlgT middle domain-containing protein [Chitinibacter sp. GC72]
MMLRTFALALGLSASVLAAQHEGIAPLGSEGLESARRAAIADALENAALFNGANLTSHTQQSGQKWGESSQLRGAPLGEYRQLKEWQSNGFLHVIVDVDPAVAPAELPSVAAETAAASPRVQQCHGGGYKRKILVSHIWIQRPVQMADLDRFSEGLQLEMVRKFYESGAFLPQRTQTEAVFELQPQLSDPLLQPERVREMARRYAVQFIVGAVVRDLSTSGERYTLSRHRGDVKAGERKLELNLPLVDFTGFGFKATPQARRFEYELFVFDGVSGALINRHLLAGKASGTVMQDSATSMGTAGFKETDFGRLIDTKLQQGVDLLSQDVGCIPFSARITRVEKGRVYFDAGVTSQVAVGDTLQVYRIQPGALPLAAASFDPSMSLGLPEEIVGSVQVMQVQPLFSVGAMSGNAVQAGDYVRFVGREGKK